jgi:Acetyltransferase (GNAT) domain
VLVLREAGVSRQERYVLVSRGVPGLARDTQRNIDKAEEAMKKDGHLAVPEVVSGQRDLLVEYPGIARLYAARNKDAGRAAQVREFHQRYWLADELVLLIIDGEIAAWDLLRTDHDVCRVLAGQMVTSWKQYRPGRQLEVWLLERASRNPAIRWLDWGEGNPETLLKLQ